ncbi:MAG: hypothetical protein ACOY31_08805 [Bacillota bacterium]
MFQIDFYETSSGRSPVADWFDELNAGNLNDIELLEVIKRKIGWLEEYGLSLGVNHIKCLTKGRKLEYDIWELKIPFNNNTYRIFLARLKIKFLFYCIKFKRKGKK